MNQSLAGGARLPGARFHSRYATSASKPGPMAKSMDLNTSETPDAWCLEGFSSDGSRTWRTVVRKEPFRVGRRFDSDLILPSGRVSIRHARLFLRHDTLWLRDLGSTNGTFLNGEQITSDRPLHAGDVIHFADQGCCLVSGVTTEPLGTTQTMSLTGAGLDPQLLARHRRLRRMLRSTRLRAAFQPVVGMENRAMVGYELLGRGEIAAREILPLELFDVAGTFGVEIELSVAFRAKGLEESVALPGDPVVFVNTHPTELDEGGGLVASLRHLRSLHPSLKLVLEIHEAAVAKASALQEMSKHLTSLGIGLAFDDFGIGQTRLLELIDASPHYVKFDRVWIKDLHRASRKRREMLEILVGLVRELDVATVAEGVETADEARACADVGFELAQGYFFGRPAPAASFAASP